MNEILSNVLILVVLVAAFAGLVVWVRNDTFTGLRRLPRLPRPQRTVVRETAERRPATYESHATTATA